MSKIITSSMRARNLSRPSVRYR